VSDILSFFIICVKQAVHESGPSLGLAYWVDLINIAAGKNGDPATRNFLTLIPLRTMLTLMTHIFALTSFNKPLASLVVLSVDLWAIYART